MDKVCDDRDVCVFVEYTSYHKQTFTHCFPLSLFLVLASCCSLENNTDNVVLTLAVSQNTLESFRHDRGLKRPAASSPHTAATCVAFGGKSRYLTVGDASGAVCLWDLKKKTRVRHYFHSGAASLQATLDPTDASVLSLTHNALHVFRLREGTLTASLTGKSYTTFCTSTLEPTKIAIGSKNGSVHVWDVATQTRIISTSPHTSAITGVAYSCHQSTLVGVCFCR